jgi:hypothetical protein
MALTDSEVEQARKEELTNLRLEAEERKARILRNVHAQMAETDSWAAKR